VIDTFVAASDTHQALEAFWRGALGSGSAFFSGTLVRAIPLTILGTGIALAFRAGVFNIGAEGQLLAGAVAATALGLHAPTSAPLAIALGLGAASLAGAAWAGIAAVLRMRFGVLEVISTIMLNFVAADLVGYLVHGPLQEPSHIYPQTEPIAAAARLPKLWTGTRLHAGVFIAAAVAVSTWAFLRFTAAGFRVRVVGASADAARVSARVDVERVAAHALIASGALAGLAGGIELSGVTYSLYENLSPGYGFSAIAVAILARLDSRWVPAAALLFAVLETGALGMQRDAGVPSVLALAFEACIILVVLAASGTLGVQWRSRSASNAQGAA
jgi:simple sugar transport system permease protein